MATAYMFRKEMAGTSRGRSGLVEVLTTGAQPVENVGLTERLDILVLTSVGRLDKVSDYETN